MANITQRSTNVTQQLTNCKLTYDLTEHSLTVVDCDRDEALVFKIWRLPDNPGGFDLTQEGQYIEVHNPTGVDFVPVEDFYDTQP